MAEYRLDVIGSSDYSPVQNWALRRLHRFVGKVEESKSRRNRHLIELSSKATYSCYLDCVELGIGYEAERILQPLRPQTIDRRPDTPS